MKDNNSNKGRRNLLKTMVARVAVQPMQGNQFHFRADRS